MQRLGGRMAAGAPHFVVQRRVDVEAKEVEILSELAAEIDIDELAKVVEDEPVWIGGTQDLDLVVLKGRCRGSQEAMVVLHVPGAGIGRHQRPWQLDLG